jgi:putative peptidoglycan lipid II flippase
MKKIITRASASRISFGTATTLLIFTTLFGQLLSFGRTMLVNASFSDVGPQSTDAFFAAIKIPDFFFYTLAAGALGVTFIPVLSEKLAKSDRKGVWELATGMMNLMAVIMAIVGVIILIFAPQLINIVAKDLSPEQYKNAVTIMRLMSFSPLFFTVSGILTAVQQTFGRFFFFAMGPIIYNLCIIASIFAFRSNIGLIGLGIGALIGGIAQLGVACIGLTGLNFHYNRKLLLRNPDMLRILRQLPPRSIDQGIDSINSIVETNRARALGEGYVTAYENAFTLHQAPILLVGTTVATASFPRLVERLSIGRPDLFRKDFINVFRLLLWSVIPVAVVAYVAREYMARLIYKNGAPTISVIFGFFAIAIVFRVMYSLLSRYFYAHKDTWTPLIVSFIAIGLNIFLAFNLARPSAYGAAGLSMAQMIVAGTEVVILLALIAKRDRKMFNKAFLGDVSRLLSASGFTILGGWMIAAFVPLRVSDKGFFVLGFKLGIIVLVVSIVHVIATALLNIPEGKSVLARAKIIIFKQIKL